MDLIPVTDLKQWAYCAPRMRLIGCLRLVMMRFLLLPLLVSAPLCAYDVFTTKTGTSWHWHSRHIQYWINSGGSGLSSDQAKVAIQSAFQSWEQTGVGLTFSFMGITDSKNSLTDHKNVVFWSSDRTLIPEG